MKRISDPQVSPDARWIVFVQAAYDLGESKSTAQLWIVGADGAGLRRLTAHTAKDSNPRWAPDGRSIFFLSSRSGSSQVWRIAVDGGEAEQITNLPLDAGCMVVSPDGRKLAVAMEVFPDGATPEETKKRLDQLEKRKATGRIYDRLMVRHWDTWKDGRRSHVFVLPASGGKAVDVMRGMDTDVPPKPFGGAEEIAFTPDSRAVVFACRDPRQPEAWTTAFSLYLAPIDGTSPPVCLTEGHEAILGHPVFSPDGKTLAYLAMSRPGYESDRQRIILRPWNVAGRRTRRPSPSPAGPERYLTPNWDRSADTIVWSRDGKTIITTAQDVGQRSLFAIGVATGKVRTLVGRGDNAAPVVAGDRVVFLHNHLRSPNELHAVMQTGGAARLLTRINTAAVAAARMGEVEQFSFAGWNNETVYGYIVRPADFNPRRKYPVAFLVHGGPQGSFGNNFHYRWNPQVYAGAGYAAVMVDFHGSTGYGQAFTDSIRGDWGEKPLVDLQEGLAAALERYPWMDGGCVAALGASYGGYMINWIAGRWPDRFRCLVCHDGNLDERMAYYETEELWFPEWEHFGTPWENPEGCTRHNPIDHVQNWKTPMLVIHGGRDYRVVETQGLATFTALQRRGIPSKLLYFPDENHWVLKPANSLLWHETVLGWLRQWLK